MKADELHHDVVLLKDVKQFSPARYGVSNVKQQPSVATPSKAGLESSYENCDPNISSTPNHRPTPEKQSRNHRAQTPDQEKKRGKAARVANSSGQRLGFMSDVKQQELRGDECQQICLSLQMKQDTNYAKEEAYIAASNGQPIASQFLGDAYQSNPEQDVDNTSAGSDILPFCPPPSQDEVGDSPDGKSGGNWRLKAVLEALQETDASCLISPSRPVRVKTLVRAFESLMSSSSFHNSNNEEKHLGFPLQFSYHNTNASTIDAYTNTEVKRRTGGYSDKNYNTEENEAIFCHGKSDPSEVRTELVEESCASGNTVETSSACLGRKREDSCDISTVKHRTIRKKCSGRSKKYQATKQARNDVQTSHFVKRLLSRTMWPSKPDKHSAQQQHRYQLKASICSKLQQSQPFKLRTEARGQMKEQEFIRRLQIMLAEEERFRVPLAQGLPWSTDEPEIPPKPPVKESTKPLDVHLHTQMRAPERAEFDNLIMEKLLYVEHRRREQERLLKLAEEEQIKKMRQDMIPKAQLMPYFDRPFRPRRSSKRPTIPKEPNFHYHNNQTKRAKCSNIVSSD